MKTLGLLMVAAAFLAGAYLSSLDAREVNWAWLLPVLLIGAAGMLMRRRALHREARSDDRISGNLTTLRDSLRNIVAELETLDDAKAELPPHQARFEIDRRFRADLNRFAEARESMSHVFGLQAYADVMSAFAAGERYVNRVWSASADGYVDEVRDYLGRARAQFGEAEAALNELFRQQDALDRSTGSAQQA